MKKLILLLALCSLSLFASTDVSKVCSAQFGADIVSSQLKKMSVVGDSCFIKNYVTNQNIDLANISKFLKLEKEIGEQSYDVHHVNELYIYKVGYAARFSQRYIDYDDLQGLANFSVDQLAPYSSDELYSDDYGYWEYLDVFRHAKVVDKVELTKELAYFFGEKVMSPYPDDLTAEIKIKIDQRAQLYDLAINDLATLIMGTNKTITIYPLLDNNNENVQDAQWAIVGENYILILNKFYWL